MPSSRLANRVALITGSSSGLGRAIALAYASEGAKVCCVDLYSNLRNAVNPSTGKADSIHNRIDTGVSTSELLNQRYGSGSACFVQADCTSAPNIEKAVRNCVLHFGRLDILVNNAGISVESTHERVMRIHDTSEEDYDKTMSINTKGVFLGCKYGLRQMLEQEPLPEFGGTRGWIVNTASVQAFAAYYGTPAYAASKAAVVGLTRQIALDYAKDKIHCNAICPGFLKSVMTRNLEDDPEAYRTVAAAHPWGGGGFGNAEDVARAAVYLASDDLRWITGVALPVDGGFLCQ